MDAQWLIALTALIGLGLTGWWVGRSLIRVEPMLEHIPAFEVAVGFGRSRVRRRAARGVLWQLRAFNLARRFAPRVWISRYRQGETTPPDDTAPAASEAEMKLVVTTQGDPADPLISLRFLEKEGKGAIFDPTACPLFLLTGLPLQQRRRWRRLLGALVNAHRCHPSRLSGHARANAMTYWRQELESPQVSEAIAPVDRGEAVDMAELYLAALRGWYLADEGFASRDCEQLSAAHAALGSVMKLCAKAEAPIQAELSVENGGQPQSPVANARVDGRAQDPRRELAAALTPLMARICLSLGSRQGSQVRLSEGLAHCDCLLRSLDLAASRPRWAGIEHLRASLLLAYGRQVDSRDALARALGAFQGARTAWRLLHNDPADVLAAAALNGQANARMLGQGAQAKPQALAEAAALARSAARALPEHAPPGDRARLALTVGRSALLLHAAADRACHLDEALEALRTGIAALDGANGEGHWPLWSAARAYSDDDPGSYLPQLHAMLGIALSRRAVRTGRDEELFEAIELLRPLARHEWPVSGTIETGHALEAVAAFAKACFALGHTKTAMESIDRLAHFRDSANAYETAIAWSESAKAQPLPARNPITKLRGCETACSYELASGLAASRIMVAQLSAGEEDAEAAITSAISACEERHKLSQTCQCEIERAKAAYDLARVLMLGDPALGDSGDTQTSGGLPRAVDLLAAGAELLSHSPEQHLASLINWKLANARLELAGDAPSEAELGQAADAMTRSLQDANLSLQDIAERRLLLGQTLARICELRPRAGIIRQARISLREAHDAFTALDLGERSATALAWLERPHLQMTPLQLPHRLPSRQRTA